MRYCGTLLSCRVRVLPKTRTGLREGKAVTEEKKETTKRAPVHTKGIYVRVSPVIKGMIQSACEEFGMTESEYIRFLIVTDHKSRQVK